MWGYSFMLEQPFFWTKFQVRIPWSLRELRILNAFPKGSATPNKEVAGTAYKVHSLVSW